MKQKRHEFRKSWQALRQANVNLRQLPGILREFRLWFQITKNLKEIEGSWPAAIRKYFWIFKGVPRKQRARVPEYCPDQDISAETEKAKASSPDISRVDYT